MGMFLYLLPLLFASGASEDLVLDPTFANKCSASKEARISNCLQPIIDYANSIQKTSTEDENTPFSLKGGEVFSKLCNLYTDFKDCTADVHCHSISIEAVEASYGYMCGAGHNLFEKHAACFAEVEAQKEYNLCRNAAGKAMDDAVKTKKHNLDKYFYNLCQIMDDYLRCCRPFVVEKCGSDAWRLVAQITVDSLRVTMPDCDVNRALL
ncbi:unnamed protein product [Bursaphelenchus xylophilus]|uniref:(pine wood nematode) hypothetical protein n=1 Tax=Bursaphelenchus xylophilus TaxID=6326 RepID=A0A1I7RQV0_BURXY|nr:unnamed protein product [Bursaphelenchus xylophilus]CAG9130685.1 unnamed protein product [Bursaphelenchus xylophilus]